ncbi:MAG: Xaa-Pro aminopeptidase [Actinomycetales bacterium]|nr:MAG: Xaa-Pro aminopeptidase [Actinomycetales bacterium]
MAGGWASRSAPRPPRADVAPYAAARRAQVSAAFPGERLVIPAGGLKIRSNDTDYPFRPHSAFAHLTGMRADTDPDAVLVLHPRPESGGGGHEAIVYLRPPVPLGTEQSFSDNRMGAFWVGQRPGFDDLEAEFGIAIHDLDQLRDALAKDAGEIALRVVRDADPDLAELVDEVRLEAGEQPSEQADQLVQVEQEADSELAAYLSVLRMVKDEWEVDQLRAAIAATKTGFEAIIAELPDAVAHGRGERWIEGLFGLHARHAGNGVGYDSICAAGDHATTLHWTRNSGDLRAGELALIDAGVELDSLYTADITRTLPVDGSYTDTQREIYEAVYAAQQAGLAAVRPGARFSDIHAAAIRVIAEHLHAWGLLPDGVSVEDTLDRETGQYHRRWMVHGTSHHLGLDVHDCARATREQYQDAELRAGMVLTVEPGLYFKADDELVPERFRGIGIRIEDDVLVTETGCENLSAGMPSTPDDVEAWIRGVQSR